VENAIDVHSEVVLCDMFVEKCYLSTPLVKHVGTTSVGALVT